MKRNRLQMTLCVVTILLAVYMFGFSGNTHEPTRYGPSVISWLTAQWSDPGSQSMHGWLIPIISLGLLWKKRKLLIKMPRQPNSKALPLLVFCMVIYWLGCRVQQPRLGVLSLIGLCGAVPLYLWGTEVARHLRFPAAYLILAIPMGFLTFMTFPLRLMSCTASVHLLNGLSIPTRQEGTAILSVGAGKFALDVADPCSGLQFIIALSAVTALFAYLTQKSNVKRTILFFSAIPLAMAGNIVRVTTIAIVATLWSQDAAMKVYHSLSGIIVFSSAMLLMMLIGTVLNKNYTSAFLRWKPTPTGHS